MTLTLVLTLLLKSLVIFALAGAALFALRRFSAARSLVCLLTLGALLALPLFSLVLPGWHLPVIEAQAAEPTPARPSPTLPQREGEEVRSPGVGEEPATPERAPLLTAAAPSSSSLTGRTPAKSLVTKQGGGFLLFYLLGLVLASLRPLLGLWGIRRLSRDCAAIADLQTHTLAAQCAALLRLKTPHLCRADVPVPMTWGWHRPVVVLPLRFAEWPEGRLRSVLLHEMAHIKRCDWPGHRLADFVCAVYWFHPLVWLTARRLRVETETACDDLVLASGVPALDYARHLLEIASTLPPVPGRSPAAIAMAQTSQIESRLQMILDKTRTRRALARRVVMFALVPGTAALVALAVLRLDARAQTAPARVDTVQLLGVQDIDIHHTDHRWRNAAGAILPGGVDVEAPSRAATDLFRSSNEHNLRFAFYLPNAVKSDTVVFRPSGSFVWLPLAAPHSGQNGADWILNASFPGALKTTALSVGVAAGPWTETVDCPKTAGKVRQSRPSGDVLFTLISDPHEWTSVQTVYGNRGQTPPKSAYGSAVLMVSDHFHSPSPLPVDETAVMISSYASRTRSGDAVQKLLRDGENYERAVCGLDQSGRIIAKLTGTYDPSLEEEDDDRFKMEQLISIPKPLLKRIVSFRLVARPYQWTQFNDVALQLVK